MSEGVGRFRCLEDNCSCCENLRKKTRGNLDDRVIWFRPIFPDPVCRAGMDRTLGQRMMVVFLLEVFLEAAPVLFFTEITLYSIPAIMTRDFITKLKSR